MNTASEAILVFMTAANADEASRLAEMLVSKQLAACVQILPRMDSVFRWQGNIERQSEVLLIAKTVTAKFDELDREVRVIHSYETPEVVAIPASAVSAPYFEWLKSNVQ